MDPNLGDDSVPPRNGPGSQNPGGLPWPQVTREQWNDYRWQLSHRITSIRELAGLRYFSPEEAAILDRVNDIYHLGITPYYLSLIRFDDPADPIALQAIPARLRPGGAPLPLPTDRIEFILKNLRKIPHVEIIRIGTRVPVVLPMRIDDELCALLSKYGPIWLNTQFHHPREVTEEARKACDRLLRAGVPVSNQTVLLKGINDHPEIIRRLNTQLVKAKVRPYYLFQCDQVRGLEHFRTRLSKGVEIMEALRGHTTGLAIPTFVVDVPGGGGKIPLMPNYILSQGEQRTILRNYEGIIVSYEEPRDKGRPSARPETEGIPPRLDVYRLMTGEIKALIPAGNERMARRRRRGEAGSPTT